MVSRRRFLTLGVGGLATFAGCSDQEPEKPELDDERRETEAPPGRSPDRTTDFEVRSLRAPVDDTFVTVGEESEADSVEPRHHNLQFILDEEMAATLVFDVEHDDIDATRSFVETTDYEDESVVVHQRVIDDCYERRIEYVTVEPDRYRIHFCQELKDTTSPCVADETTMEALFVRVTHAYDSPPSSQGSSERSQCSGRRPEVE